MGRKQKYDKDRTDKVERPDAAAEPQSGDPAPENDQRVTWESAPLRLAPILLSCASLFAVMRWFWGFVQDDAYISLRYAANFAAGQGLVMNPGERVEGFTNLTWTLLASFFIKIGIDPLDGVRVVGAISALALTILVWLEAGGERWMISRRDAWSGGFASIVIASFTTVALWSIAGLEESFFTLLAFAGYREFARGHYPRAAGLWVLATWTRPEGPLFAALAVFVRALTLWLTRRRPSTSELRALAIYGLGFGLLFAYRLLYFGELAPNTFYVKGVANWASHKHGWNELWRFFEFNDIGVFAGIAGVSIVLSLWLAPRPSAWDSTAGGVRRPHEEPLYGGLFLVGFLYYLIRVGGDLLPMFRLYMPLLPFIALWCGRGVNLLTSLVLVREEDLDSKPSERRSIGPVLALSVSLVLAWFAYGAQKESYAHPEYKGTVIALDKCHGTAGRYLERVAVERGKTITVLAQDMGLTPYVAPHVRFVDVIGLTDHTVAHTLYSYDYTPYIRYLVWNEPGWQEKIKEMETKLRNYLVKQDPDFILVNLSCDAAATDAFRGALARLDSSFFQPYVEQNTFYYGLGGTEMFKQNYKLSQGFEFSAVHYLVLFEKVGATPAK